MEQAVDNYNIAETTVGNFRFYEVALCESFLNIVSRWGRLDEESKCHLGNQIFAKFSKSFTSTNKKNYCKKTLTVKIL